MPSISPKDRVPLCLFSYEDGRRCRTPRIGNHPHFCFYHAQKESQSQAAANLADDLAYFFSGDYLSACDISSALSRLIPAVVRGDIKPRLARTVAYMLQTHLQAIHLSQREYANAFGTEGWRKVVRASVNSNYERISPLDPEAAEPQPQPPAQSPAQAPARSPAQPSPPTPAGAGLARPPATTRRNSPNVTPPQPLNAHTPTPTRAEAALRVARSLFPQRPNTTPHQPVAPQSCHPERSEGSCLDPAPSTTDETRLASAPAQFAQPTNAPPAAPPRPNPRQAAPNRDPYAVHFDLNYRLRESPRPY